LAKTNQRTWEIDMGLLDVLNGMQNGPTVGAVIILFVWHRLKAAGVISDPADRARS
jgi:hypothetical protein